MIETTSRDSEHKNVFDGKMRKVLMSLKTLFLLFSLFILIYSANFYFLSRLNTSEKAKAFVESSSEINFSGSLDESDVKQIYKIRNQKFEQISKKILKNFAPCANDKNYTATWSTVDSVSYNNNMSDDPLISFYYYSGLQIMKSIQRTILRFAKRYQHYNKLKYWQRRILVKERSSS